MNTSPSSGSLGETNSFAFFILLTLPQVTISPIPRQDYLVFSWRKCFDLQHSSPAVYFTFSVWDKINGPQEPRYESESGRWEERFPYLFIDTIKADNEREAYREGVHRFWENTFILPFLRPTSRRIDSAVYWQWTRWGSRGLPDGMGVKIAPIYLGPLGREFIIPLPSSQPSPKKGLR